MSSLREALMEIRAQRGSLTPEIVVEEARDPEHPLHHRFDWDDTEAARKWRLSQAQEILRVSYVPAKGMPEIRAFWPTREGAPSTYEPIEDVLTDDVQRELLLRQMDRDWKRFKVRYGNTKQYADLLQAALQEVGS